MVGALYINKAINENKTDIGGLQADSPAKLQWTCPWMKGQGQEEEGNSISLQRSWLKP